MPKNIPCPVTLLNQLPLMGAHQGASTMCRRSSAAMKASQSSAVSRHSPNSALALANMSAWRLAYPVNC